MNKINTLTLAVAALSAASANAFEFSAGPIEAQLNTSISYGVGMRTEDVDKGQVHAANYNRVYGTSYSVSGNNTTGSTYNYDDGTLNYKKNHLISNVLKGSMDLELVYGNGGFFGRGSAFYDSVIMDESPAFKPYIDETKDAAGSGYDLLDAFVWYNFDMGNVPVSARLGRQVVSWGESTFIFGGINSINPLNASAIRKPGVEVKEVLLPVNMAYGSFGVTDNVTLEAFYQLEWEKTRPDACGTFFATNDIVPDGCGPVFLAGANDEITMGENYLTSSQAIAPKNPDEPEIAASDDGQYGLALRWYSEELGDTEFGLYYMNIHSRLPLISGEASGGGNGLAPVYQIVHPEDIKLSGISFNRATESGWSIGGEISLKQDYPMQWNSFELILGGLRNGGSLLTQQIIAPLVAAGNSEANAIAMLAGEEFDGFDRFDVWQAQMTFIKFFDQVLGASRLSFVSEVGATFIPDLPDLEDARYGRSGAYGIGTMPDSTVSTGDLCTAPLLANGDTNTARNLNSDYCTNDGYVDELSAGIRMRASLDYPSAIFGVNLKPEFSLGYDVGTAPEPGGAFVDGRIKTGLAMKFDYLNRYSGGVAYTMFDGSEYDQLVDRDNVTLNLKVSF